jgi:hypothetical protein
MRFSTELTFVRVLAIFAAGIVAGIQIAIYLCDSFDDGVADGRSGFTGVILIVLGFQL